MAGTDDDYTITPDISQEEFEKLLEDSTFVDFFNTFLSLPIFGKRLRYNSSDGTFEIDPPVKRTCYHVIQAKVKVWVRRSRLPFFLKTDLFLDYSLCKLILGATSESNVLIPMHLSSVEGMHAFRRFLRGTMGEHIFSFWLDAERYRRQTKPQNRRYSFREIQSKYLKGGAPFELTELMKWKSLCGGLNSGLDGKSFASPIEITKRLCQPNISVFSASIFVPLQKIILEQLRSYWAPKFVVHREKIRMRYKDHRGRVLRKQSIMTDLGPDAEKLKSMREMSKIKSERTGDKSDLASIEEYMQLNRPDSTESTTELEAEEEERQRHARWHEWFWGIVDREENGEEEQGEEEGGGGGEGGEGGEAVAVTEAGGEGEVEGEGGEGKGEDEDEGRTPKPDGENRQTNDKTPEATTSTVGLQKKRRKYSKRASRKHSKPSPTIDGAAQLPPDVSPETTPESLEESPAEILEGTPGSTESSTPEESTEESTETPISVYSYHITGTPTSLKSSSSSPFPLTKRAPSRGRGSRSSVSDSALSTPDALEELTRRMNEGKFGQEESDGRVKRSVRKTKVDEGTEKDDQSAVKPKMSSIEEATQKADQTRKFIPRDLTRHIRINLAHPDQPYALAPPEKKGKFTMFEALHSEGAGKDEWKTSCEKRYTPELEEYFSSTLEAIQKAPLPRLIQLGVAPGDVMGVFNKPRTALPYHILEYQRILQDAASQSGGILAAVASDRLAGGPFYDYLERIREDTALIRLQFWNETQRYLAPPESLGPMNKYRMAMALIGTFLLPDSPRVVPINSRSRKKLIDLLPIDQGDALLTHVSHNVVQELTTLVLQFIRADEDHFTSSVTRYKKIVRVQPQVEVLKEKGEEETESEEDEEEQEEADYDSGEDTSKLANLNMLRALQLVISLQDPGFDQGDDEEEEIEEGEKIPSLKEVNKQRDMERARRVSHFYGQIKKEVAEKKEEDAQVVRVRPNRPRNFQECLHETVQFAWFRTYLQEQSSETPLLFWQAVENMKNNCKDAKSRQARANVIVRKYFINIEVPATENLQCKADIIRDIPVMDKVTPPMLISAQTCVVRTLEEQWFRKYVGTFPEEDHSETLNKYAMRNTLAGVAKIAAHGKTRGLWAMFASNVRSFQKGINTIKLEREFIEFLKREKEITIEHNNRRHALNPTRRMINNRSIGTEKLVNDLQFWKEVTKFKEMVDNATECAKSGNYSADDQKQVESKANTITRVYIDSELPPKIQINISTEQADNISNLVRSGIIERGIFHEAALAVFTTLIHYWKKFMVERRREIKEKQQPSKKTKLHKKDKEIKRRRLSFLAGIPYRRIYVTQDDEIRWTYSILHGLRLAIPVKMMPRRMTRMYGLQGELSL